MTAPLVHVIEMAVPAVSTAGNDETTVIGQAPFACTVTSVQYVAEAGITGAATNNRSVSLVNKGAAGAGTAAVATLGFVSGVNATAFDEKAIPISATASDAVLAASDTLAWVSTHVGTGITDPGGIVRVTLSRS